MYEKASPTTKFPSQFTIVAMVTAIGLASWRKSSDTINHGMAPGEIIRGKRRKMKQLLD